MRFQQLKRDPNSVMRKKLVKSKKAWVVVSSLSIAGGLLMMTAPSYVAKAEVTTAAPTTQTETKPSSTGTTSQDSSKVTVPATSAPAPTTTDDGSGSKTAEVPTTKPAVESGTEVKSTEDTSDLTKESAPETTPKETSETTPTVEKPTVKDAPIEAPSTETETAAPDTKVAALSVAAPATGVEQETTVPDGSTDEKTVVTPADPEATVPDGEDTEVKAALDSSTPLDSKTLGKTAVNGLLADGLTAETLAAPVAELAPVPVPDVDDKGTGWTYTSSSKNLDINGPLTDFKAGDTDHWNGHASTITNITVSAPVTAPTNSSYMFANMENLKTINIDKFDTLTTTNMEGMFKNDPNLLSVDFSHGSVHSASNISHMFENDTLLETLKFSNSSFKSIENGSYAFANCTSLKNLINTDVTTGKISTSTWQASNATDLRAMFKNDISLKDMNVASWGWTQQGNRPIAEWPNTGDSSKGEGMFDGTSFDTITLNENLYFSPETGLTSNDGTTWTSDDAAHTHTFSGIPVFTNGKITNGLGFTYDGVDDKGQSIKLSTILEFKPSGKVNTNDAVTNYVTVPITLNGVPSTVTVKTSGNLGKQYDTASTDPSMTIDGITYTTTNANSRVVLGQTQAKALDTIAYVSTPAKGGTISIPTNVNGQNITVTVPDYYENGQKSVTIDETDLPEGYHLTDSSVNTVTVTYNGDSADSKFTIDPSNVQIAGDNVPAGNITVSTDHGDVSIPVEPGSVGDTKTVNVADAVLPAGYHLDPNQPKTISVTITADKDNPYSTKDPVAIAGDDVPAGSITVSTDHGDVSIPVEPGSVGDTKTVNVADAVLPAGYHLDPNQPKTISVTITADKDNPYSTKDPVAIAGDDVPAGSITVSTDHGDVSIPVEPGSVGDTKIVNVADAVLPAGYHLDSNQPKTISVTITANKTAPYVFNAEEVKLTGTSNDPQTLTIKNPNGTISKLPIPGGNYGDSPQTITAPSVAGYTAPSVIVTYNASGIPTITYAIDTTKAITADDELSYTRIPSSSGSSTVKPVDPTEGVIEQKVQTISTYSDKPDVELYQIGSDNKMSQISNRDLATASNWYSDATVTIDGVSYYRVATNEWAKMSQAYPYQALNLHIRTYNDSEKALYKAENIVISNETLAPSSSWITDRETYVINNTKYYRVATNEFVNADDVYVYSPVSMVVTTHANQYTTVYNAKGAAVTDRSLNSDSSWKVDSIAYINGDKYYRVATDEFVKASDVDVNTLR
ncbi:SLAP domain-containing protein [Companilactobacillus heilongjiangensis]|uniref:S-layer protein C-terminal domain-containing protein n=1 Tax=Companilactobacillus heilongjiangensis TaxID=1074467 RepID=A0A0K2LFN0_9LACO|nr:SLAP domain-containing protein [Companilactobacillus heilongjiangensis]ALB30075.1 hypothetical protein JP39_12285 [Companilactobacillus heilongjiangensis]